jgi:hypothetical protein
MIEMTLLRSANCGMACTSEPRIGSKLMDLVEERAREKGVAELALDTSEKATQLIEMYQVKDFRFTEYVQWKITNYRSMVFSKKLAERAPNKRLDR